MSGYLEMAQALALGCAILFGCLALSALNVFVPPKTGERNGWQDYLTRRHLRFALLGLCVSVAAFVVILLLRRVLG